MWALNWTVVGSREGALVRTAWGCGGAVADIVARGWAVDNVTRTVLRIDGNAHGCEVCLMYLL